MWLSCGPHVVFIWLLRLLHNLSRVFLWDKKTDLVFIWLSCGFPSLGCAANRFRPPRPAGDQIQPYVRSPHKHLSPRHGHPFAPKNTIESHSFFFIPKFKFLSLLLQFFRMLCLRCSAPRPYFVSRPLLPHALCHMDSLLQKPLCSIAIIASETPRATWIA